MWLVLAMLACTPAPGPAGRRAELTAERLREHTAALTAIGPRLVATPAEAEAEEEVARRLRAAGYDVERAPFTWDAWRPGTAAIEVDGRGWEVQALSPSPAVELVAPLAEEGGEVQGAVGIYSSDTGTRAEHFLRAASQGAAAFVRVTDFVDFDGGPLVEVGHTLEGSTLPGLAVDRATGAELRALVGRPATVRVAPDIAWGHTSANVVARAGPEDAPREVYVVAHYDSWHLSECAFDNALGVGALLSMAERLATEPDLEARVVFVATSGEEQGLQGAFAWVDRYREDIGPGDVAVTLDVLWSGEGRFQCMASTDALRAAAMDHARAEGIAVDDGGQPTPASDHFPFQVEGADAVWCGRWPDRHYHTDADTLDALDLDEAAAALRAQYALVVELAGGRAG